MARKQKPRKRDYIPPPHEIENKKEKVTRQRQRQDRRAPRTNARGQYVPPPPSWKRTFKRLPVYFIALAALQYFLPTNKQAAELSETERLVQALITGGLFTAFFAPFIYWFEKFGYNRYMKRHGLADTPPRRGSDD